MNYAVCAFREYETKYGMIEEEPVKPIEVLTTKQAEKKAKELYDQGGYSSIYIQQIGSKDLASRYWNPREGISAQGVNWVEEFEAGYEV